MLAANHGHVVTGASNAGLVGVAGLVDYCASKFGAVGTDEALRFELKKLGKDGVFTTCVCPYYISTGMFDGAKTRCGACGAVAAPRCHSRRRSRRDTGGPCCCPS